MLFQLLALLLWGAGAAERGASCLQGADPHVIRRRDYKCCYIVKDGIDQCRVGFLRHDCAKFDTYDGVHEMLIHPCIF